MTKDEAQKRINEWRIVEATTAWQDLMQGLGTLERVHELVLRKSKDPDKLFRSQGALEVVSIVAKAKDIQLREAVDVLDGKVRTTERSARVQ
jgi:hypothetical protein